ncbi:hypothetical protein [Bacillus sp. P14.5]|uniref:hypothetical protein n=1 Tax=Bacillus sp. P14.5 TaxID=1983400 RepID=UPI0013B05B4B|nr:hypothetical protein [Bacillus sp. P14.5]
MVRILPLRAIILAAPSSHWPVFFLCRPLSWLVPLLIGLYSSFAGRNLGWFLFSLARILSLQAIIHAVPSSHWPAFFLGGPLSWLFSLLTGPYSSFAVRYLGCSLFLLARILSSRAIILAVLSSHWPVFFLCGPFPAFIPNLLGLHLFFQNTAHTLINNL